jgi:hypothetical protein
VKLRRFNEQGLAKFRGFLDTLVTDNPQAWPEELLTEAGASDPVGGVDVEQRNFGNRLQAASYLYNLLNLIQAGNIERDTGLWSWLAFFYFEQLCSRSTSGNYKPGSRAKWIPESGDFRRYYRHLLAGPYLIYRAHRDNPERALILLCGASSKPGEIVEQLASRQELITSPAVVEAATKLYFDEARQSPKAGAAGKGAGSARRLADILNQFDVTWDFAVMEADDLLDMLPKEFDKFRPN